MLIGLEELYAAQYAWARCVHRPRCCQFRTRVGVTRFWVKAEALQRTGSFGIEDVSACLHQSLERWAQSPGGPPALLKALVRLATRRTSAIAA